MYLNGLNRKEIDYESKERNNNLHELVLMRNSAPCDNCSLQEQCRTDRSLCTVIAGYYNSDERFINRGEVTDIKIDKEE